jgi:fatty acid desaturase
VAQRQLAVRSDRRGLRQLVGHLAILIGAFLVLFFVSGNWTLLALIAYGVPLTFLFAPLHETIHHTAYASRWLNQTVAFAAGLILVLPPRWFQAFHFDHHLFTQDPARDPELGSPKPDGAVSFLIYVSGLPFWRDRLNGLIKYGLGFPPKEKFVRPRKQKSIISEARLFLLIYVSAALAVSLLGWWDAALRYWILPSLLGQPFLRLYLLAEHTGCEFSSDMLRNSRTTRTNALVRLLAWNMPYHAEHHAYPWYPFHALPTAHEHVANRIAVSANGYNRATRDLWAAIQSGLADPKRARP